MDVLLRICLNSINSNSSHYHNGEEDHSKYQATREQKIKFEHRADEYEHHSIRKADSNRKQDMENSHFIHTENHKQ